MSLDPADALLLALTFTGMSAIPVWCLLDLLFPDDGPRRWGKRK